MNDDSTQMDSRSDDYELRDEYDLAALPIVAKGRFAEARRQGMNVVVLDPEIRSAFPDDATVNAALRLVLQMAKLPHS